MVDARPVLVCHRGASALAPENSLDAFRVAMGYGVDYSELDVHLSRAGDLVVAHDPPADAAAERALPRLAEVFDLVRGRMGVYVELKGDATGAALADLIHSGAAHDVALIAGSFRHELVTELRAAAPEVPRSILFGPGWEVPGMLAACRELGAQFAHPCFRPIDATMVADLHAANLLVMTPHTNAVDEAHEFVKLHVDIIASDDPRILLELRS
ncbi:MAG: glycerophosphodiester phosphodiesterase [Chloroflexi bacterium]|nr:glycerophosphodiester phosphodiesterase [Chloroflexota bacterium]